MKNKLLTIASLFILFTTGCSVDYELTIKEDMSIHEKIQVNETMNYFYENYKYYDRDEVIDIIWDREKEKFKNASMTHNIDETGTIINSKYKKIKDYCENNNLFKQYFEKVNCSDQNGIIKVTTEGKFYGYVEQDFERYAIDKTNIMIKIPFKVINNNADEVKEDTYIWKIDKETKEKKIEIEFDTRKNIQKENDNKLSFIIVIFVISVIIFSVAFITQKIRKTDNSI